MKEELKELKSEFMRAKAVISMGKVLSDIYSVHLWYADEKDEREAQECALLKFFGIKAVFPKSNLSLAEKLNCRDRIVDLCKQLLIGQQLWIRFSESENPFLDIWDPNVRSNAVFEPLVIDATTELLLSSAVERMRRDIRRILVQKTHLTHFVTELSVRQFYLNSNLVYGFVAQVPNMENFPMKEYVQEVVKYNDTFECGGIVFVKAIRKHSEKLFELLNQRNVTFVLTAS